jgi:hypothetical protein
MDRNAFLETPLRRKRRRNSSPGKEKADVPGLLFFPLDQNKKIAPALTPEDKEAVFADRVLFFSKKLKFNLFQLIITQKHIHLFKDKSGNKKGTFRLRDIDKVAMSHQSDNFMLIKFKGGGEGGALRSILIVSRLKIRILQTLAQTGSESPAFPLTVADRFQFMHSNNTRYVIVFTRTEFGVQTSLYADNTAEPPANDKKHKKEK